jgi:hypothetical protein
MDLTSFSYLYIKYSPSLLSSKNKDSNSDLEIVIAREPLPAGRQGSNLVFTLRLPRTLQVPAMTGPIKGSGSNSDFGERREVLDHGINSLTTMIRTMRMNNLLIQTFPMRSE